MTEMTQQNSGDGLDAATTRITIGPSPFVVWSGWDTWTNSRKGLTIYA